MPPGDGEGSAEGRGEADDDGGGELEGETDGRDDGEASTSSGAQPDSGTINAVASRSPPTARATCDGVVSGMDDLPPMDAVPS